MRLAGFQLIVVAVLGIGAAFAQTRPAPLTPETLRELALQWWRWRVALPQLALPDKDAHGHFCDVGQSSKTWFVAAQLSFGASRKPVHRTCAVPAGRRIFFPVVTTLRIAHDDVTCSKARDQVSSAIDHAESLVATLDGADLLAGGRTRWGSDGTCFRLNLPADGPSSDLMAAADGYWLLLEPLPAGHHTLVYGGKLASDQTDEPSVQTTTYDLDVR